MNDDTVATPQSTRARKCCRDAACAPEPLRHMAYTYPKTTLQLTGIHHAFDPCYCLMNRRKTDITDTLIPQSRKFVLQLGEYMLPYMLAAQPL
jgi:hypothetical protein